MKDGLRFLAIIGNVIFILWVVFNAIDSGFSGTKVEVASFVALISLLAINAYLLLTNK